MFQYQQQSRYFAQIAGGFEELAEAKLKRNMPRSKSKMRSVTFFVPLMGAVARWRPVRIPWDSRRPSPHARCALPSLFAGVGSEMGPIS